MNTKTDGISSGMEAVVATDHPDLVGGIVWSRIELEWINKRLSDAEAIISAKDAEIAESDHIRDRCAHLLAETAVALKGPEKALHRHGWQDLPEVAAKQSAALKLAREALTSITEKPRAYEGIRMASQALAAIDEVLKGEHQ